MSLTCLHFGSDPSNGKIVFIIATLDTYVAASIDLDDYVWTSVGGEILGCFLRSYSGVMARIKSPT